MSTCGIYKITNLTNNKVYIGQSKNIEERWSNHRKDSFNIKDVEYNSPLHRAIRKYGLSNFEFQVIEECLVKDLDEREKYYIRAYESYPLSKEKGYNQTPGGQGPSSKIAGYLNEVIELLRNSSLTQKKIAEKFNITEEMIQGINTGRYWRRDDIEYPVRNKIKRKNSPNYCPICGKEIKWESKSCIKCRSLIYKYSEEPIKRKNKNSHSY